MGSQRLHPTTRVAQVLGWISLAVAGLGAVAMLGGPVNLNPLVAGTILGFLLPPFFLLVVLVLSAWAHVRSRRTGAWDRPSLRPVGTALAALLLSLLTWPYMASSGHVPAADQQARERCAEVHRALMARLDRWQEEDPRLPLPELARRLETVLREEAGRQGPGMDPELHRIDGAADRDGMMERLRALATTPHRVVIGLQVPSEGRPGFLGGVVRLSLPRRSPGAFVQVWEVEAPKPPSGGP